MIRITDAAQAHFSKLLAQQAEGTNIRVFVVNPGTPNAECGVSYCPADAVEINDTELKFDGFSAYVDIMSAPYLEDAEIDLAERVEYVLQSQVNPQLAAHGGRVSLVEITADGFAIVQFGGGCNGCSMIDVTLKEGIEKELLAQFNGELKGVKDITEHQRGDHSFY